MRTTADIPTRVELQTQLARAQARLSGLSRERLPGDPRIDAARVELGRAQQQAAVGALLDAVALRVDGTPAERWVPAAKAERVPMGVSLCEAVELIAHLIRQSDRPAELLAALRQQATGR